MNDKFTQSQHDETPVRPAKRRTVMNEDSRAKMEKRVAEPPSDRDETPAAVKPLPRARREAWPSSAAVAMAASASAPASWRREGDHWTIEFAGRLCRLRDAKGLHCLAHLLLHSGERIAATVLLGPPRGTDRVAGGEPSPSCEAARVVVTKRIRAVVKKIEPVHPSLAHHLDTCVRTGALCVYRPDPESPLRWEIHL